MRTACALRRSEACRYYTQRVHERVLIQIELTSLIKQARMKPAADQYDEIIPMMCRCLKTSSKPWLQALRRRMIDQYRTNDAEIIARQCAHWQTLMKEKSQASLAYQLVSFDTAAGYVGQVAHRKHTYERMVEHWRGIRDYDCNGESCKICIYASSWCTRIVVLRALHLLYGSSAETNTE